MSEPERGPQQPSGTPEQRAENKPAETKTASGSSPQALSDIERLALEMVRRKPPRRAPEPVITHTAAFTDDVAAPAIKPATETAPWIGARLPEETNLTARAKFTDPIGTTKIDPAALKPPKASSAPAPAKIAPPAVRPMFDDHFRLTLTTFQSASLAVAIFGFVIAAIGMAASGWTTAHDWTCRVGLATSTCPAPPLIPKPAALPEIPS